MSWVTKPETPVSIQTLLRNELETRCQRNSKYSLRAFARDLELSAPRLSHILSGTQGLSRTTATQIAKRLGWSKDEQDFFCDLVESHHARSPIRRAQAKVRLNQRSSPYKGLELDAFRIISDWYHFAIMELTQVEGFQSDADWIAKALGISVHEASAAIERLLRLEALENQDGKLRLTEQFVVNTAGVPSEAVRKFHRQVLEKAESSLTFQTVDEREMSALILAVDESDIPEAKKMIRKFRDEFNAAFSKSNRKQKVYALGIQFFKLQQDKATDVKSPKNIGVSK